MDGPLLRLGGGGSRQTADPHEALRPPTRHVGQPRPRALGGPHPRRPRPQHGPGVLFLLHRPEGPSERVDFVWLSTKSMAPAFIASNAASIVPCPLIKTTAIPTA